MQAAPFQAPAVASFVVHANASLSNTGAVPARVDCQVIVLGIIGAQDESIVTIAPGEAQTVSLTAAVDNTVSSSPEWACQSLTPGSSVAFFDADLILIQVGSIQ